MCFSFCFFLIGIPAEITNSAVELKNCAITTVIKKYKSIIKKKKNKHDKTVLLAKTKFNSEEVLISKALIDSNKFASVNDVQKEHEDLKKKSKVLITNKYVWCNKENINSIKWWLMVWSKYAVSSNKKSRFIKHQEAKRLLSIIWKIPFAGKLLKKVANKYCFYSDIHYGCT